MTHYKGNYPPTVATQQMQQGEHGTTMHAAKEPRDTAAARQNSQRQPRAKKAKTEEPEQH